MLGQAQAPQRGPGSLDAVSELECVLHADCHALDAHCALAEPTAPDHAERPDTMYPALAAMKPMGML